MQSSRYGGKGRRRQSHAPLILTIGAVIVTAGLLVILGVVFLGRDSGSPGMGEKSAKRPERESARAGEASRAARDRAKFCLERAEKYARNSGGDFEGILERYEEVEKKFGGTPEGKKARDALEALRSGRERQAQRTIDSQIELALKYALAGEADEARSVLSRFQARYAGTKAEKKIHQALKEVAKIEVNVPKDAGPRADEEHKIFAGDEEEPELEPEVERLAGPPSATLEQVFGKARLLAMEFAYDEAMAAIEEAMKNAVSPGDLAQCRQRIGEVAGQRDLFRTLQVLLCGDREGPLVTFGLGSTLRVDKADAEGLSAANARMSVQREWRRLPTDDLRSILEWAGKGWAYPLEIATFAYDHGSAEWGDIILVEVAESDPEGVSAWLARRQGTGAPRGGYVFHEGEWLSKEEADHLAAGEVLFQGRWQSRAKLLKELRTAKRDRDKSTLRAKARAEKEEARATLMERGVAEVKTLRFTGDISRRIDIVIVADGFTLEEGGSVERCARQVEAGILKVPPFRNYREYINVHLVRLFEEESGINELPEHPRRTKVGSTLEDNTLTCDTELAWQFGEEAPDADLIVVLANVNRGRATGGSGVITLDMGGSIGDSVIHELGHAFGDLDDEYVDPETAPGWDFGEGEEDQHINTTRESNPRKVKWHYWNFPPVPGKIIGCFEGAYYHDKGYYRPARDCRMRSVAQPEYCLVCQEQMERMFYLQLEPLESAFPESPEVSAWADEEVRFEITAITIKDPRKRPYGKFRSDWWVGGERTNADRVYERKGSGGKTESRNYLVVQADSVGPGRHEVAVHVELRNDRIRLDHGHLSSTRVWTLAVSPHPRPQPRAPKEVRGNTHEEIAFSVQTADAADDSVYQIEARHLPKGASFDSDGGFFRWIPGRHQKGFYRVEFVIGDGTHHLSHVTDIRVQRGGKNSSPIMKHLGTERGAEGIELEFAVEAVDIDGDHLVFWAEDLPRGATLDPETGLFHWEPSHLQAGAYDVRLWVADASKTDEQTVTLEVQDKPVEQGTVFRGFEIILGLRSSDLSVRPEALDQLEGRYGETSLIREYARQMRFPSQEESSMAIEALRELLGRESEGWRRAPLLELIRAIEPHSHQFVDRPDVLAFFGEVAETAADLNDLDKRTRQRIKHVRDDLERIRKYTEARLRE